MVQEGLPWYHEGLTWCQEDDLGADGWRWYLDHGLMKLLTSVFRLDSLVYFKSLGVTFTIVCLIGINMLMSPVSPHSLSVIQ